MRSRIGAAQVADAQFDVVIAGYGPTGAVLAAMLGGYGIRTLVIEPQCDIYPLPRAVHFDDEIMQIFQQLGIADAVLNHATPSTGYEFRAADGQVLLRFSAGAVDTPSGWKSGYLFHQPGIERAIRAKVAGYSMVEVRLGASVCEIASTAGGVVCAIDEDGVETTVTARWLVAADGANSSIRAQLGIELDDYNFDEPWLVVDALVGDASRLPTINLQICDPARPTTCVFIGKGRHRWEFMLLPGEDPTVACDDAFLARLLAPWDCDGAITVERRAVYRFHGIVAERWRSGSVLLAGDAAHQMPPFAGQGMCSGIRDAANLAWKLDAIVNGGADTSLMDTYQLEREPNVRAYIGLAIGMGQVVCTLDPAVAAMRDAHMLAERAAGVEPLRPPVMPPLVGAVVDGTHAAGTRFFQPWALHANVPFGLEDVLGAGAWLLCRSPANVADVPRGLKIASIDRDDMAPFSDALTGWLDTADVEAVLVRPDRYVFGCGDADMLTAAWRDVLAARDCALVE